MDDAQYAEQKARVERYTNGWVHILEMGGWHVEVCWHREKADLKDGDARAAMMETEARWQYMDATVHVYLPSVQEVQDDSRIEMIVVHEYQHVLLNELRPLVDDTDAREHALSSERLVHEEHAATALARAFIWVRDHAGDKGATGEADPV